ncbi:hypothetical protein BGX31_008527 [Mortierella sp. GBA43]|nr:hypothetical protein BGX31_008527 [Mortierella sp. GBA43]
MCGRNLDAKSVWEWKQRGIEDSEDPLPTLLGLDWKDVVWGLVVVASQGTITGQIFFNFGFFNDLITDPGFYKATMFRLWVAIVGGVSAFFWFYQCTREAVEVALDLMEKAMLKLIYP